LAPVVGWTAFVTQVAGRIDQGDVAERLREIAHQALPLDVVLFGQKSQVVAQTN
jgi:hypothetical protein